MRRNALLKHSNLHIVVLQIHLAIQFLKTGRGVVSSKGPGWIRGLLRILVGKMNSVQNHAWGGRFDRAGFWRATMSGSYQLLS